MILKKSKNKTRYLILGLLNEQPLSGYEIKKLVDMRFSFFWSESFGQIYPQLRKLELEGAISKRNIVDMENTSKRDVKKYCITDKGIDELKEWLKEPVEKEVVRYELLLKLYFSNNVSSEVMLQHIMEFQVAHRKQLGLFKKYQEELQKSIDTHENYKEVLMVLSFGQKVWNAYDEWCEEMIHTLNKK